MFRKETTSDWRALLEKKPEGSFLVQKDGIGGEYLLAYVKNGETKSSSIRKDRFENFFIKSSDKTFDNLTKLLNYYVDHYGLAHPVGNCEIDNSHAESSSSNEASTAAAATDVDGNYYYADCVYANGASAFDQPINDRIPSGFYYARGSTPSDVSECSANVPDTSDDEPDDFENYEFYVGLMSPAEARSKLKDLERGTYLLRLNEQ